MVIDISSHKPASCHDDDFGTLLSFVTYQSMNRGADLFSLKVNWIQQYGSHYK